MPVPAPRRRLRLSALAGLVTLGRVAAWAVGLAVLASDRGVFGDLRGAWASTPGRGLLAVVVVAARAGRLRHLHVRVGLSSGPDGNTRAVDLQQRQRHLEDIGLDGSDLLDDPAAQFATWFADAGAWGIQQPEAMVLSTADEQGRPSSRHVLLKSHDEGLVFFTNYGSRKAGELEANPWAAVCFGWIALSRQVRARGPVTRVSSQESDEYFATRPRASQIGAWASAQSQVIADRDSLERAVADVEGRFAGRAVERPAQWGGYRLEPVEWEFWQGRPSRLHDRFRYRCVEGAWILERLSP